MLDRLGYEVAPFGGGSVRLSAVPELMARQDPLRHLLDLLEDFQDRQRGGVAGHAGRSNDSRPRWRATRPLAPAKRSRLRR